MDPRLARTSQRTALRTTLRRRTVAAAALSAALLLAPSLAFSPSAGAASNTTVAQTAPTPPATGTVSGAVTVTGAPKTFSAFIGVAACKGTPGGACPLPQYSLASQSSYTITLTAGSWSLQGFYELGAFSGPFLGKASSITVAPNSSQSIDFTIAFSEPGVVHAVVKVTNIPFGTSLAGIGALACPAYAPYSEGTQPLECAQSGGPQASFPTLPPGRWLIYPTYGSRFGETVLTPGTPVKVRAKHTSTMTVAARYAHPTNGEIRGAVTLTNPPKTNSPALGVVACPGTEVSASCALTSPAQNVSFLSNGQFSIITSPGKWTLAAEYTNSPYGGTVLGTPVTVTVTGGTSKARHLKVTFDPTGTVSGALAVNGVPGDTTLQSTSILACPQGQPANPDGYSPQCAGESSGTTPVQIQASTPLSASQVTAGKVRGFVLKPQPTSGSLNSYAMDLPAGQWLLYPSYSTIYGTTIAPSPTTVAVDSGANTSTDLAIDYSSPADGALTGIVSLFNAPSGSAPSQVQACRVEPVLDPPPPFPAFCSNVSGQVGPDGVYQLALPPGTWWVSEIYYEVIPTAGGGFTGTQAEGAPQKVTITAGVTTTINLSATYGVVG